MEVSDPVYGRFHGLIEFLVIGIATGGLGIYAVAAKSVAAVYVLQAAAFVGAAAATYDIIDHFVNNRPWTMEEALVDLLGILGGVAGGLAVRKGANFVRPELAARAYTPVDETLGRAYLGKYGSVGEIPTEGPLGRGGGGATKGRVLTALPDDEVLVVRAGKPGSAKFLGRMMNSEAEGISVNSAPGLRAEELTIGIRTRHLAVTTRGELRRAGAHLFPDPIDPAPLTVANPTHYLVFPGEGGVPSIEGVWRYMKWY